MVGFRVPGQNYEHYVHKNHKSRHFLAFFRSWIHLGGCQRFFQHLDICDICFVVLISFVWLLIFLNYYSMLFICIYIYASLRTTGSVPNTIRVLLDLVGILTYCSPAFGIKEVFSCHAGMARSWFILQWRRGGRANQTQQWCPSLNFFDILFALKELSAEQSSYVYCEQRFIDTASLLAIL